MPTNFDNQYQDRYSSIISPTSTITDLDHRQYQPDFDLNLVLNQLQNETQYDQFYQKSVVPPPMTQPIMNEQPSYDNLQNSVISESYNMIYETPPKKKSLGNPINHNPHPGRPRIKSAHNVIEQRYRNKINDKFNLLQESVPTLKILATKKLKEKLLKQGEEEDSSDEDLYYDVDINQLDDNIDLEGLEPARKLNKGTILAKSIEYIKHLELKNQQMKREHEQLLMKAKLLGIQIDKT